MAYQGRGLRLIILLGSIVALCTYPLQTSAQKMYRDSVYHLQEVTINGFKEVTPHQTISRNQIVAMPSNSVADALKYMAGVQIKDYGGLGGQKTVNVRSLGSQHISLMRAISRCSVSTRMPACMFPIRAARRDVVVASTASARLRSVTSVRVPD